MSDLGLKVASTSDALETVQQVANGEEARVSAPEPEPEAEYKAPDQTREDSWEHPQSERRSLLERLEQAERELDESEQHVVTNERLESEEQPAGPQVDEALTAAIHQKAAADAARDYRLRMGLESNEQIQLNQMRQGLEYQFKTRLAEIVGHDPQYAQAHAQMLQRQRAGIERDIAPQAADALLAMPGGAEAVAYLVRNPEVRQRISSLSPDVQVAEVGRLTALATQPRQRAVSNAPAPIRPVGGSATPSNPGRDIGDLPYQEFKAARQRQIKARYQR